MTTYMRTQWFVAIRICTELPFIMTRQDFIPVVDTLAGKVIHVDWPPHYTADGELSRRGTNVPPLSENAHTDVKRERIPPPREAFDFLPDLMLHKDPNFKQREDVKPLHVVQPEGVSFKMNGNVLEWQKWSMHISFTHREGIAISTITFVLSVLHKRVALNHISVIMTTEKFALYFTVSAWQRWLFRTERQSSRIRANLPSIRMF